MTNDQAHAILNKLGIMPKICDKLHYKYFYDGIDRVHIYPPCDTRGWHVGCQEQIHKGDIAWYWAYAKTPEEFEELIRNAINIVQEIHN